MPQMYFVMYVEDPYDKATFRVKVLPKEMTQQEAKEWLAKNVQARDIMPLCIFVHTFGNRIRPKEIEKFADNLLADGKKFTALLTINRIVFG